MGNFITNEQAIKLFGKTVPVVPQEACLCMDMTNEDYHETCGGISSTTLKMGSGEGWQACRQYLDGQRPFESRAMVVGSALHLAVSDMDLFVSTFHKAPEDFKTSTSQKFDALAARMDIPASRLLTEREWDAAIDMAEAIRLKARNYRSGCRWLAEPSIFWFEENSLCKIRPDIVVIDDLNNPRVADYIEIKSGRWVRPNAVLRAFWFLHYNLQSSFYQRGITHMWPSLETVRTKFMFVESVPPHNVRCYQLAETDEVMSDRMIDRLLTELEQRRRANDWIDDTLDNPTEIRMGLDRYEADEELVGAEDPDEDECSE